MMSEKKMAERTDAEVASSVRKWVYELNKLLEEAAQHGLDVDLYLREVGVIGSAVAIKMAEVQITKVTRL